jgi:hypothetical protein
MFELGLRQNPESITVTLKNTSSLYVHLRLRANIKVQATKTSFDLGP